MSTTKATAVIPFSKITKIELYMNTSKLTLAAIKKKTGCSHIINGGLFSTKWKALCNTKANGTVYCDPKYSEYGMAWNTKDIVMTKIPDTVHTNWIGMKALTIKGTDASLENIDSAIDGKRGRSAIGLTSDSLVLFCSRDGTSYARTPSTLRTEMKAMGCTDILMLDGGGSSQCDFDGTIVQSSVNRIVQNLILVYTGKTTTKTTSDSATCPYAAPTTTLKKGASGTGVRWLQWQLTRHGYTVSITGNFLALTETAVKQFQKAKGLTVDGIVGPTTRNALLS
jgi:hypothetical protein